MVFWVWFGRNYITFLRSKFQFCVVPLNGVQPLSPKEECQWQILLGCDHLALSESSEPTIIGIRDQFGVGIGPSSKKLAVEAITQLADVDDSGDILFPMDMIQHDSQSVVTFDIFIRLLLYYALQVRCYFWKCLDNTEFWTTCFEVLQLFTPRCIHCWSFRFRLFTFTQYAYIILSTSSERVT